MNQPNPRSTHAARPKKSSDLVGLLLALATAVLAVIVVGTHVYLASRGKTDPTSTFVLNVLALTFSAICTIWVGRWSAHRENKAFIRAALRTTYGLHEGLEVAERSALEGISRMKSRASLAQDVMSGFWEEVLGRVLDQLRGLMRRAQETIANWQEFGPEEVERLVQAEQEKATAINELTLAVEQARCALREFPDKADTALRTSIEALEQERARLSASSALAIPATGEARKLLAMGALEEAISAYSSLIATSPETHTLYVARARARYLAGDTAGALDDLKAAEGRCPADARIARLRDEIQEGRKLTTVTLAAAQPEWREHITRGNAALAVGNGEKALNEYKMARQRGLFPWLAAQDEAMALMMLARIEDAKKLIQDSLPDMTGPFVRVQAFALLALANALEESNTGEMVKELDKCLEELRFCGKPFVMTESPLQFFVLGLRQTDRLSEAVRQVFRLLLGTDASSHMPSTVGPAPSSAGTDGGEP